MISRYNYELVTLALIKLLILSCGVGEKDSTNKNNIATHQNNLERIKDDEALPQKSTETSNTAPTKDGSAKLSGPLAISVPIPQDKTQCGMVSRSESVSKGIIKAFCPEGNKGKICMSDEPTDVRCTDTSKIWYQDAIYFAAGRDSAGNPTNGAATYLHVILSPGLIRTEYPLRSWFPFEDHVGIHVVSGVHLRGSKNQSLPTVLKPGFNMRDSADPNTSVPRLFAMVLASDVRIGPGKADILWMPPLTSGSIKYLNIDGQKDNVDACQGVNPDQIFVRSGIQGAYARGSYAIENNRIEHVNGNAIDLGALAATVPEFDVDRSNRGCREWDWCPSKRLMFEGSSPHTAVVRNNYLCDAKFGGITIIGKNVLIENNEIRVSKKVWTSNNITFGLTMGVSAGFIGSSNVLVRNNLIRGGDYGVGSDGSPNIYETCELFQFHWQRIYDRSDNYIKDRFDRNRFPGNCSQNHLGFDGDAYVKARQILLDLAVTQFASSNEQQFYDKGFITNMIVHDNDIKNSVVGVSLYRVKDSHVFRNKIHTRTNIFRKYGVLVASSYSNWIYGNGVDDYEVGIEVSGEPTLEGQPWKNSKFGSSFNGIGLKKEGNSYPEIGNTLRNNQIGIQIRYAGFDNSVRSNIIENAKDGCRIAGLTRSSIDWTTSNVVNGRSGSNNCNNASYQRVP